MIVSCQLQVPIFLFYRRYRKNKLNLNPLLVTYNKYFNTELGIKNLANLRIRFDCDILIQNVNPISVKISLDLHSEHLVAFIDTAWQDGSFKLL